MLWEVSLVSAFVSQASHLLLLDTVQHGVAGFIQSVQASGTIAMKLLPMSLRDCRDPHDSFSIFSTYKEEMSYTVVNTVPSRAQPAYQNADLLLWRHWLAAQAPVPLVEKILTHTELNWAVFQAVQDRQNLVHKPIHLLSCSDWEGSRLLLSGFELFGCQKSLVVVQAAVKFVSDEARIMCAGGWREEGWGFFSFLLVGNIIFLFCWYYWFGFGNTTFS